MSNRAKYSPIIPPQIQIHKSDVEMFLVAEDELILLYEGGGSMHQNIFFAALPLAVQTLITAISLGRQPWGWIFLLNACVSFASFVVTGLVLLVWLFGGKSKSSREKTFDKIMQRRACVEEPE